MCKQDHYSHNLKLDIEKLPAKITDRFSPTILCLATVLGTLLFVLGLYHFFNLSLDGVADLERNLPPSKIKLHTLVPPVVFSAILMILGLGTVIFAVLNLLRYKTVFFDGNNIIVKHHPLLAPNYTFTEPLYNYSGVRLRVKFYQYGILNKNKFIIELYHKDESKIVPLYISTGKHRIRKLWQYYAQTLHMPALTISEKSMVSRNFKDLDKPYREVVAGWRLPKDLLYKMEKPSYITFKSKKSGEKMIKIKKLFFDAYSFLSIFTIIAFGSLFIYSLVNYQIIIRHIYPNIALILLAFLLSVIIYAFLSLITKDIIVISAEKLFIFRKIGFIRIRDDMIDFKNIKGLDINFTPTSERYFLAIVSDTHTTIFGNKLPVEGLRWIRAVLINEIGSNIKKSN